MKRITLIFSLILLVQIAVGVEKVPKNDIQTVQRSHKNEKRIKKAKKRFIKISLKIDKFKKRILKKLDKKKDVSWFAIILLLLALASIIVGLILLIFPLSRAIGGTLIGVGVLTIYLLIRWWWDSL